MLNLQEREKKKNQKHLQTIIKNTIIHAKTTFTVHKSPQLVIRHMCNKIWHSFYFLLYFDLFAVV